MVRPGAAEAVGGVSRGEAALNEALLLLSQGLDLCVRAKKLDDAIQRAVVVGNMSRHGGTKCLTPALWVQDAYDKDLADWEGRVADALRRLSPFADHLPTPSGITALLALASPSPVAGTAERSALPGEDH